MLLKANLGLKRQEAADEEVMNGGKAALMMYST
jgi:hypothetical protein